VTRLSENTPLHLSAGRSVRGVAFLLNIPPSLPPLLNANVSVRTIYLR